MSFPRAFPSSPPGLLPTACLFVFLFLHLLNFRLSSHLHFFLHLFSPSAALFFTSSTVSFHSLVSLFIVFPDPPHHRNCELYSAPLFFYSPPPLSSPPPRSRRGGGRSRSPRSLGFRYHLIFFKLLFTLSSVSSLIFFFIFPLCGVYGFCSESACIAVCGQSARAPASTVRVEGARG